MSDIEEHVEKVGPEILRARDEWGYTPAHWAALDGNVEIMRYLVERSAPVDLPCLGTQGPKPIHWACRKGHTDVVQVLLKAGVAVNAADFKGNTLKCILLFFSNNSLLYRSDTTYDCLYVWSDRDCSLPPRYGGPQSPL